MTITGRRVALRIAVAIAIVFVLLVLRFFGFATAFIAVSASCVVGYAVSRWKAPGNKPVPDGPEGEEYKIYTTEFDLVLEAEEVPNRIRQASPDASRGWIDATGDEKTKAIALASDYQSNHWPEIDKMTEQFLSVFRRNGLVDPANSLAVTFLVDQSGSMRGLPMAAVQASISSIVTAMAKNAGIEILGFSTVGWHGGNPYQQWKSHGRPLRPGRLCALLHIIYKSSTDPDWSSQSQVAMLDPDILRENIDGEALRWASERLLGSTAQMKILLVVSDGAPVDDATLLHNGVSYLDRDLRKTIDRIETDGQIRLGAVGVGFDVSRYYRRSRKSDLATLSSGMLEQLIELIAEPGTSSIGLPETIS